MSRLQKKCLIATVGFHLLLVLTVVFGAAFFVSHPKPDDTQILTAIPANLVDAAFNSGVKSAQAPAPTPVATPPQQPPTPIPPPPTPVKPAPAPTPEPPQPKQTLIEKVEQIFKPAPQKLSDDDLKPAETEEKPAKPTPKKIQVNLTQVTRNTPKVDTADADAAREAKLQRDARLKAVANAARSIEKNASSATTVEMPGTGSVSYANYASVVKSIYEQAWTPPSDTASDDAVAKVSVTISRDGTVISSRVLNPSGDSKVDASVQRTLDRVNFVAPFPDGAKEKERTFIISFNLKAKRMLG
jgi:TonB family protein